MAVYYLSSKGELVLSLFAEEPGVRRRDRPRCGAKTRKGTRCRAPAVWDRDEDEARNGRCKLHGGLSTGPRTKSGRDAIRASNSGGCFAIAIITIRALPIDAAGGWISHRVP
jgi:hypothetical protein